MLEPVIIDPNGEEIKEKVIMSLTSFFNDNIHKYDCYIKNFIIKAKNNNINITEIFIKRQLLKDFEELVLTDLINNYERVLNNKEKYENYNYHLFYNVINNIPYNNDDNNTYLFHKFRDLYEIIIMDFTNPILPITIASNSYFIKHLNNKLIVLNKDYNHLNKQFTIILLVVNLISFTNLLLFIFGN